MLWHGRFEVGPADELLAFTVSLPFDQRLASDDLAGSRAHVRGLGRIGILSDDERDTVLVALDTVGAELASGEFVFRPSDEDIHTAVERRVTELAGSAGAKLHTGRSRNDQIATDLRLYVKRALLERGRPDPGAAGGAARAGGGGGRRLPARATRTCSGRSRSRSPTTSSRTGGRWRATSTACSTAAGALMSRPSARGRWRGRRYRSTPTAWPPTSASRRRFENSLDAVSDRDFVAEALFALTLVGVHLSRIGEEVVLWTTEEFGFATLDDAYATGSSMLPQKKNPDIAELARGKAGRLIGNLAGLLATLKGLPIAYNRDLQEDKEPLFDAVDQVSLALSAMGGLLATIALRRRPDAGGRRLARRRRHRPGRAAGAPRHPVPRGPRHRRRPRARVDRASGAPGRPRRRSSRLR